jgi:hypothetical protein
MFLNQNKPVKSTKKVKKNEKRRKRSAIINFHVTEQEKEFIEIRIRLSGLSKQEFFIQYTINQQIITYGNIKTFSEIKLELKDISKQLRTVQKTLSIDDKTAETIRMIIEIISNNRRTSGKKMSR